MPLPYTVLLGPEGLAQTGLSVYWLAPVSGFGTYEIWIETTQNANEQLFGSSNAIGFLGHLNAFYNLSSSTYLELAASGVVGDFEADTIESTGRAFHLEAGLSWRPPGRELYRGLTVRGAFLGRRRPEVGTTGIPVTRTSVGGFVGAEVRLNRSWLAGLRYDRVEDPAAPGSHAWMLVPTLTWWQSEFVRLRGEYDWLHAPTGTRHQVLIQLSFAMGPHKHENY
jgi:hypothetical protein